MDLGTRCPSTIAQINNHWPKLLMSAFYVADHPSKTKKSAYVSRESTSFCTADHVRFHVEPDGPYTLHLWYIRVSAAIGITLRREIGVVVEKSINSSRYGTVILGCTNCMYGCTSRTTRFSNNTSVNWVDVCN